VVSWIGMATWFWLLRAGDATRASQDFAAAAAVAAGIYLVQRA
jgi:hypothetical protein